MCRQSHDAIARQRWNALISQMGKHDGIVGFSLAFQTARDAVGQRDGPTVFHAFIVFRHNQIVRITPDANHCNFFVAIRFHDKRLDSSGKRSFRKVIIGANHLGLQYVVIALQRIQPVVEFMIANRSNLVTHAIHQFIFHPSSKK